MAQVTKCQTPGAQYHTRINAKELCVTIDFGRNLNLNEEEAILLETNVHNALELVLAQYYQQANASMNTSAS